METTYLSILELHTVCESRYDRKGVVCIGIGDDPGIVSAAGGQRMHSLGLVRDIPVMIQGRTMPVDLIVVSLKNHEVILGMDWSWKESGHLRLSPGKGAV